VTLRAYGSDRLEPGTQGRIVLRCLHAKGWVVRREKTQTSAEHPGTAVRWDGEFYEVLAVEAHPAAGLFYTLAPWDEVHAFRVVSDYSEEAEKARDSERRDHIKRSASRSASILLAPLAGLLPGPVQERMEAEFNAPASMLTIISAVPLFFYGAFCTVWLIIMSVAGVPSFLPEWATSLGVYFFVESALRILSAYTQGRPAGSLPVVAVYSFVSWIRRRAAGQGREADAPLTLDDPSAERVLWDEFRMREPLFTFLSGAEQEIAVSRYGFAAVPWARRMSVGILVFAGLNALLSLSTIRTGLAGAGEAVWLAASAYLSVEQIVRLGKLSRGVLSGSALAFLVRPFTRRFLLPAPASNGPSSTV